MLNKASNSDSVQPLYFEILRLMADAKHKFFFSMVGLDLLQINVK